MSQTTDTPRFESKPVDDIDDLFEGEPVWNHDHDSSSGSTPEHEVNNRLRVDDPYRQPDPSALNQMASSWYDPSNVEYGTHEMTDEDMAWQSILDQFVLPELEGTDPNWYQLENNTSTPHVLTQPTPAVMSDEQLLEGSPQPSLPPPQVLRLPEPAQPAPAAQGSSTILPSIESLNLADRLNRMQKRRRTKPQKPRPRPAAAENQAA